MYVRLHPLSGEENAALAPHRFLKGEVYYSSAIFLDSHRYFLSHANLLLTGYVSSKYY